MKAQLTEARLKDSRQQQSTETRNTASTNVTGCVGLTVVEISARSSNKHRQHLQPASRPPDGRWQPA